MNPVYVPLLSALAGAIIGSLSSIAMILIQAKISDRRERLHQAALLAMEEYKLRVANVRGQQGVMPFSAFLHHHIAVLKAVEDNDLTPERIRQIAIENQAITDVQFELEREWIAKKKAPMSPPNG
jgi:hypothetical protein